MLVKGATDVMPILLKSVMLGLKIAPYDGNYWHEGYGATD